MARHQPLQVLDRPQAANVVLLVRHQRLDVFTAYHHQTALDRMGVILTPDQCICGIGQTLRLTTGDNHNTAPFFKRRFETGQVSATRATGKRHRQPRLANIGFRIGAKPVT